MRQVWLLRNLSKHILDELILVEGEAHYGNIGLHEFETLDDDVFICLS